jgi:seryl-tRNA synthetase
VLRGSQCTAAATFRLKAPEGESHYTLRALPDSHAVESLEKRPEENRMANAELLKEMMKNGAVLESSTPGVILWSNAFQSTVAAIDRLISGLNPDPHAYEVLRPSPVMSRSDFERSGYMSHFPRLAGTVHAFDGGEAEHDAMLASLRDGREWATSQSPTEVVLTPASCYPVYPMLSRRSNVAKNPFLGDVMSHCYRHEPSMDLFRLQSFQMREFVCVGSGAQVHSFLESWRDRAVTLMSQLALPSEVEPATDAFFGRKGTLTRAQQWRDQSKYELIVRVGGDVRVACISFNYHHDAFSRKWNLRLVDQQIARSGCVGFGLERLALAVVVIHGLSANAWPADLRRSLQVILG